VDAGNIQARGLDRSIALELYIAYALFVDHLTHVVVKIPASDTDSRIVTQATPGIGRFTAAMMIAGVVAIPVGGIYALGMAFGDASTLSFVTMLVIVTLCWMAGAVGVLRVIDQASRISTLAAVIAVGTAAIVFHAVFWPTGTESKDPISSLIGAVFLATLAAILTVVYTHKHREALVRHQRQLWIGVLCAITIGALGTLTAVHIYEGPGYKYQLGDKRYGDCRQAAEGKGAFAGTPSNDYWGPAPGYDDEYRSGLTNEAQAGGTATCHVMLDRISD
jgi:predicted neutral ceramidase superfamily lipid hydrolase